MLFPRSKDRGPIEARVAAARFRRRPGFRDLRIAAQLKPCSGSVSPVHLNSCFRDLRIAAQLKRAEFESHESNGFRDLRIAAQLKPELCVDRDPVSAI